jgi:chromosomal replication initiation ATPase DnaA
MIDADRIAELRRLEAKAKPAHWKTDGEFALQRMPQRVRDIVNEVCATHGLKIDAVSSRRRRRRYVEARQEIFYRLFALGAPYSSVRIGAYFGFDYTSVLYAIASYQRRTGAPKLINYGDNGRWKGRAA